jgi:hypothetical protein
MSVNVDGIKYENAYTDQVEKLKERDHLEDLRADGRVS